MDMLNFSNQLVQLSVNFKETTGDEGEHCIDVNDKEQGY